MPLSCGRTTGLALSLIALAVAPTAAVATVAGGRDSASPDAANVASRDDGPRNPAAEAATGDTDAMVAVVQQGLDCLREKGFHPGDPQVSGHNVVTPDWNPAPDSPAGRVTRECFFPGTE
jgi:hypothetical protein